MRRKLGSGMPIIGTCSLAISAACHPAVGDEDAARKPLMYGAVEAPGLREIRLGTFALLVRGWYRCKMGRGTVDVDSAHEGQVMTESRQRNWICRPIVNQLSTQVCSFRKGSWFQAVQIWTSLACSRSPQLFSAILFPEPLHSCIVVWLRERALKEHKCCNIAVHSNIE